MIVPRYGTLNKLLRVTSYVQRFVYNMLRKVRKEDWVFKEGELLAEEIRDSKLHWVKYEQALIKRSDKYEKNKKSLNLFEENEILHLKT